MSEKIVIEIDPDLEDLIPGFLENRARDVETLGGLLAAQDLAAIQRIGHSLKGVGGGYGFDGITDIGAAIEKAAESGDAAALAPQIEQLADYLSRVEIVLDES